MVLLLILKSITIGTISYITAVFIALNHSHLYTCLISKLIEDRNKVMFIFLSPVTPSKALCINVVGAQKVFVESDWMIHQNAIMYVKSLVQYLTHSVLG